MGVNLQLRGSPQGDHATDLCTNGGYSGLCAWIESLPGDTFPALKELAGDGSSPRSDRVVAELDEALVSHPPSDPDTRDVADRLADLLGDGHPDEAVAFDP